MSTPLAIGDRLYLGSILGVTLNCYGTVSDLDTPDQVAFTIEGFGSNALLNTSGFVGPKGDTGSNAPLGTRMFPVFDSVDDLPTNLTDDPVDIGKYWIVRQFDDSDPPNEIGSWWYMWDGSDYEQFKMGEPGQAGPVPDVTYVFQLVDNTVTTDVKVTQTGDPYHPNVLVQVYEELIRGPQGPDAAWDLYSGANVPTLGDTLVYDGTHFLSTPLVVPQTKFWTVPEAAFTDQPLAFGTRVPLGSFTVPTLGWDTVIRVGGHLRLTGVEADADPFIIGCEVRLGTGGATGGGTLIGRGYGNISSYVNISPHASGDTPGAAADAISPDNGRGVIPAGTSGTAATLYVNAFNDGLAGVYNFSKRGAQIDVQAIPV
jgi:hypothetical protein